MTDTANSVSTEETFATRKEYLKTIREYTKGLRYRIATTRFNDDTLAENVRFRKRNEKVGCIYCCPIPITQRIPLNTVLFVLEMNNTKNRITGIGMIQNRPICNKYRVYENMSYNRYVYMGKRRIEREDMTEEEEKIMGLFDTLCFKGAKNIKRGQGITAFPLETLYKCSKQMDLVDYVREMFQKRNSISE